MNPLFKAGLIAMLLFLTGCKKEIISPETPDEDDIRAGGLATTYISSSLAFSSPAPNLSPANAELHRIGDVNFEQSFVAAPAKINPGLGPLFNSNSCVNCHISDGRGRPPAGGGPLETMLIRVSLPGSSETGGPLHVPGFGGQLQTKSLIGFIPEGNVQITWEELNSTFPDGEAYSLRKPVYTITGRLPGGVLISPRVAPAIFGLGLLELIPEGEILKYADEADINNDGISGKANYVWNAETGSTTLGRFGWKANTPTLLQQTAAAYVNDMGITSSVFPKENCYGAEFCDTLKDDPEISDEILQSVVLYTRTLAVPARRNSISEIVKQGKALFSSTGCASCHIAKAKTGSGTTLPELGNQTIFPYTDMLLHDMGDELADNRPDFLASGKEWRTAPLWGIGLVEIVNGHTNFLHDGRARNLQEAILWHSGEGTKAKENYTKLNKSQRSALLAFLNSL